MFKWLRKRHQAVYNGQRQRLAEEWSLASTEVRKMREAMERIPCPVGGSSHCVTSCPYYESGGVKQGWSGGGMYATMTTYSEDPSCRLYENPLNAYPLVEERKVKVINESPVKTYSLNEKVW